MKLYAVFLCGATDCFFGAAFVAKVDAEAWMAAHANNPEGGIIKELTADEIQAAMNEDEIDRTMREEEGEA